MWFLWVLLVDICMKEITTRIIFSSQDMFHSYVASNCVEVVTSWQFIHRLYSQTKTLWSTELFPSSRFLTSCLRHHDFDTWLIVFLKKILRNILYPKSFRNRKIPLIWQPTVCMNCHYETRNHRHFKLKTIFCSAQAHQ